MNKALVLDFGGVISRTLFETHAQTESALGLRPGSLTWRGPFDPGSDAPWRRMQAGEMSERDYWLLRAQEVGALVGETWTTVAQFVVRARGADPARVLRPEAVATVQQAAAAGCRLAVLSNELELFYGAALRHQLPLLARFDVIVDASQGGPLKPDPGAYAAVRQRLGMAAADCVFVDDQARNVAGALAVGMDAVQLDVTRPAAGFAHALRRLGL